MKRIVVPVLIWLAAATTAVAQTPVAHTSAPPSVQAMVADMTLDEKAAQLMSAAPAIPRLGVRAYEWWNEGLHGLARNGPATVLPQAIGLAATWDVDLMRRAGEVVSVEARAKFNASGGTGADHGRYEGLTIWSPNVNIYRDPRWGRGQETYGEDPYLTAHLAVAFVQSLQGPDPVHPRTIATPKHFAIHSGPEAGRHGFDVDVSPQDLEATYLPAFRAAVVEGGAGSVMCAYNAIHGTPACASDLLLGQRLRRDWGFQGFVVTDCDAVDDMTEFHYFRPDNAGSSAASIRAGADLDCGEAYQALPDAVRSGLVDERTLDQSLIRLFEARRALGIDAGGESPYDDIGPDRIAATDHAATALEAAVKSIVLLKNADDLLPLKPGVRLAVIGPNADALESLEANYHGTAVDPITPLMGLRARFGAAAITYAQGAPIIEEAAVTVPETALRTGPGPDAAVGLTGAYFDNAAMTGVPTTTRIDRIVAFDWDRTAPVSGLSPDDYGVRWTGVITPPGPGDYVLSVDVARCFDCSGHDPVRLWIDDRPAIDAVGPGGTTQVRFRFDDVTPHRIRLELSHSGQDQGVRLRWQAPAQAQLDEVERAATGADAIVAFVGLSPDVEGEALQVTAPGFDGGDRTSIELPPAQRRLLAVAAATGKPLIVVMMSGGTVAFDDSQVRAALAAWYPGQSGGGAIARILAGDDSPSGRLPVTAYASTRDLPPFADYAMKDRTYRYFTGTPQYRFGHGLSFTRFAYARPSLSTTLSAGDTLTVEADVANVGAMAGDEVIQVYLIPPELPVRLWRGKPAQSERVLIRTLVGFQRTTLEPGQTNRVRFSLSPRDLSLVDRSGARAVVPGAYRLFIGGGQPGDAPGVEIGFTIVGGESLPR